LGSRVEGLGLRDHGLGLRVSGLADRQASSCRIYIYIYIYILYIYTYPVLYTHTHTSITDKHLHVVLLHCRGAQLYACIRGLIKAWGFESRVSGLGGSCRAPSSSRCAMVCLQVDACAVRIHLSCTYTLAVFILTGAHGECVGAGAHAPTHSGTRTYTLTITHAHFYTVCVCAPQT